jgi:hypothetical protein
MQLSVEDLNDQTRYRKLLTISYSEIITFVFDYLKTRTLLTIFFWSSCLMFLVLAITIRVNISGDFELKKIWLHTLLGTIIFPVLSIPVHEGLHIIPYLLSGARRIRIGMDLRQYIFFVTAHRYVTNSRQFRIVAYTPVLLISMLLVFIIFLLPGLWKWSFSLFLFIHTTMCAGDIALLNFYHINKEKKIFTWDDADLKEAYFYEEIQGPPVVSST